MRRLILIAAAAFALPLAACDTVNTGTLPSPSSVAQTTKIDEQAAVSAHLAYKAFRTAVETGIGAGYIKGDMAGRISELDNQLYKALQAIDAAYAAGNATDFYRAVTSFNTTLVLANGAVGRK